MSTQLPPIFDDCNKLRKLIEELDLSFCSVAVVGNRIKVSFAEDDMEFDTVAEAEEAIRAYQV